MYCQSFCQSTENICSIKSLFKSSSLIIKLTRFLTASFFNMVFDQSNTLLVQWLVFVWNSFVIQFTMGVCVCVCVCVCVFSLHNHNQCFTSIVMSWLPLPCIVCVPFLTPPPPTHCVTGSVITSVTITSGCWTTITCVLLSWLGFILTGC